MGELASFNDKAKKLGLSYGQYMIFLQLLMIVHQRLMQVQVISEPRSLTLQLYTAMQL